MDYTFWIAIVGCVTGVISLCMEISRYLSEKPQVTLSTFDKLNNVIVVDTKDEIVKIYLNLHIFNDSKRPLLLQDIYLKRPNSDKNTFENLVYYTHSFSQTPWKLSNDSPIKKQITKINIPTNIAPRELFKVHLEFIDSTIKPYLTCDHFVPITLYAVFSPYKTKHLHLEATCTNIENDFTYFDKEGNSWKL